MPIDNTNLPPDDNFPPHHIFVGVFFQTRDEYGHESIYIVTHVDADKHTFWPVDLRTMHNYSYWVPCDIKLDERPNPFRENACLISHGAGMAEIERTLGEARRRNVGFWRLMLDTYKIWKAQRIADKALLTRYQKGPLKALAAHSAAS